MKVPAPIQWIYDLWMKFAHILGLIMSKIILSILWIILFGPYAIIWKLANLKKKERSTYWIDVTEQSDLSRQF